MKDIWKKRSLLKLGGENSKKLKVLSKQRKTIIITIAIRNWFKNVGNKIRKLKCLLFTVVHRNFFNVLSDTNQERKKIGRSMSKETKADLAETIFIIENSEEI